MLPTLQYWDIQWSISQTFSHVNNDIYATYHNIFNLIYKVECTKVRKFATFEYIATYQAIATRDVR